MFSRIKSLGAAVAGGALVAGVIAGGVAQAAAPLHVAAPAAPALQTGQLPAWFHAPLTAAQVRSEVAVPKDPAQVTGRLRLTKADYTSQAGGPAVQARQAVGHVLIAGESLQLAGAGLFRYGQSELTASARAEIRRLRSAFAYVTGVTCEGYTDYGSTGATADLTLSRARAVNVCDAIGAISSGSNFSWSATGFGETRPVIVGGTSHAERADNRRVVVTVAGSSVGAPKVPTATLSKALNKTATIDLTPAAGVLPVTGYEYSLDAGQTWAALKTTGTSPVTGTITGLTNGTTYHVLVRDLTEAGVSLPTSSLTVKPVAGAVPDAPSDVSGTWQYTDNYDSYLVTLSWKDASDGGWSVTSWQYSTDEGKSYTAMSGVTETGGVYSATIPGGDFVCGGQNVTYNLEAVNAIGTSPASDAYTLDVGNGDPGVPRHPEC